MLGFFTQRKLLALVTMGLMITITSMVFAQTDTNRVLVPNQAVSGTLDANNVAQIYTFVAAGGDTVTLTLDSQTPGLFLSLVLSDEQGASLGLLQVAEDAAPEVSQLTAVLNQTGSYYVTVFATAGEATTTSGTFSLVLETTTTETTPPEIPATGPVTYEQGFVSLLNGIEVSLQWDTRDDLNLEVRDPNGESLYQGSRTTSSEGAFGLDVNGLCETLTDPPAIETATWPSGAHATGSYEILVYYVQACEGNDPVDFTVNVTVDGVALPPIQGRLEPPLTESTVYVSSFSIQADGSAVVGPGGIYAGTRILPVPAQDLVTAPSTPILAEQSVQGVITGLQPWETFSFSGAAGEVVAIRMQRVLGSLDTLVLVLDSAGNIIGANDDSDFDIGTDSYISNLRLPTDDTYTIVATRYGKNIGGTEGTFELQIIGGSSLPVELINLNLPTGDVEITLTWNTDADLQLSVRDPFGYLVYDDVTRVQSGGRLEATGNQECEIAEGEPVYYVYWPEGFLRTGNYEINVWYQNECEDTRPVIFTLYVVVDGKLIATESVSIQWNERYLTNFTIDTNGEAQMGLGGIRGGSETIDFVAEQASALSINSGDIVTGGITADNAFDLYVFEGQAGDTVTVGMDRTSGILDTVLFVIDPNGVEIANNDDANEDTTNSLISGLTLTQDGTYTIIATRFGTIYGGTTGGYELAFRLDQ